jgi:L-asparaginase
LGETIGDKRIFEIDEDALYAPSCGGLIVHDSIESRVLSINLTPGINLKLLRKIFSMENLKAVVLNTFGSGNAPSTKEFVETIEWAVRERSLYIVNVSQCLFGRALPGKYEGGALLAQAGAIVSGDMTHDAAATKLMFLLGQGLNSEELKDVYSQNLRGELTV